MNVNNDLNKISNIPSTPAMPSTTGVDSLRTRFAAKLKNLVSIVTNNRTSAQEKVAHTGTVVTAAEPQAKRIQSHRFRCSLPFSSSKRADAAPQKETVQKTNTALPSRLSRIGQGFRLVGQIMKCGIAALGNFTTAFVRSHNPFKADMLKGKGAAKLFKIGMLYLQSKFHGKVSAGCKNIIKDDQIGKENPHIKTYQERAQRRSIPVRSETESPLGLKKMTKDGCCVSMVAVTLSKYHHQNVQDPSLRQSVATLLQEMEAEKGVHPRAAALQAVYEHFDIQMYPDGQGKEQKTSNYYLSAMLKQELGPDFDSQAIEAKILSKGSHVNVARAKMVDALAIHSLIENHPHISPWDKDALKLMLSQNDSFDPPFSMLNPKTDPQMDSLFYQRFSPKLKELKAAKTPEEAQKIFQECTDGLDALDTEQCKKLFNLFMDAQAFLNHPGRNQGEPGILALQHNPQFQAQVERKILQMTSLFEDQSLFGLEGLELRKVPKMGDLAYRRSDQEFFTQIKDIRPGTYAVTIETNFFGNDASHAISLIKNANGSYTIFDPNMGSIECQNYADCRTQLEKLVKTYPEPKTPYPGSTGPNHMISIAKVIPAPTASPALNLA